MKTIVVVPTIRQEQIQEFLHAWDHGDEEFIIVQDGGGDPFDVGDATLYGWADIDAELGKAAWIIPRGTDCIRSFGIWKAWQAGADVIVTMDDDVRAASCNFFDKHRGNLEDKLALPCWQSTIAKVRARGTPYFNTAREWTCAISHGLWKGVPDLDAIWQLGMGTEIEAEPIEQVIPVGAYFPMCGMNLAFCREVAPLMYFGLQGPDYPYDRFGDIWCGILAKKILDRFQLAVSSGGPYVYHERASNVWENLRKEQPGYQFNETFWQKIDEIVLEEKRPFACYLEIATRLCSLDNVYFQRLATAMVEWARLFR